MIDRPGIYDIPAAEYHADVCPEPSLSSSIAKVVCSQSMAHARVLHPRLSQVEPEKPTDQMLFGQALHERVLNPYESKVTWIDHPDWRTKAAKQQKAAEIERGYIPILYKHMTQCIGIESSLRRFESGCFKDGKPERTLVWQEPNGIWCRARLDWLWDDHSRIDDYKTTSASVSPDALSRRMFSDGWDVQAAFYMRGLKAIDPECKPEFRFVCQEVNPPYEVSIVAMDEATQFLAEKKVHHAIEQWGKCLKSDEWPGYPRQTFFVPLPEWEEARWLEKEQGE